jgi:hypothetical protein
MSDKLITTMKGAVRDFLMPETYVRKSPGGTCKANSEVAMPAHNHADSAIVEINRQRDQMFINDIIYFLDSEEHETNKPR